MYLSKNFNRNSSWDETMISLVKTRGWYKESVVASWRHEEGDCAALSPHGDKEESDEMWPSVGVKEEAWPPVGVEEEAWPPIGGEGVAWSVGGDITQITLRSDFYSLK